MNQTNKLVKEAFTLKRGLIDKEYNPKRIDWTSHTWKTKI